MNTSPSVGRNLNVRRLAPAKAIQPPDATEPGPFPPSASRARASTNSTPGQDLRPFKRSADSTNIEISRTQGWPELQRRAGPVQPSRLVRQIGAGRPSHPSRHGLAARSSQAAGNERARGMLTTERSPGLDRVHLAPSPCARFSAHWRAPIGNSGAVVRGDGSPWSFKG